MKVLYKKQYPYSNQDKYRIFLKNQLTNQTPRLYSVVTADEIETVSGPMFALHITIDEISNPNLEIIAEVWINDDYMYVWRDQCWTIAVDSNNFPAWKSPKSDRNESSWQVSMKHGGFTIAPAPCNKVLVIHKVGTQPVE